MTTSRTVLQRAVTGQARLVAGAAALLMSWQACESLVPVAIGRVIDRAITPHDGGAVLTWIALLAGLFLVLSLSFRFGSRLSRRATEQAAHQARVSVASSILDPRARPDRSRMTGAVVSISNSDADRVGAFCAVLPRTCGALISIVVAAVVLLHISTELGLLVLLGCPVLLVAVHLLGAPLERRAGIEQAHAAEAAGLATDLVNGLRVLKGIGGEGGAADRYEASSRRSLQATMRAARAESAYDAATLLLTMCFLALVALVGGRLAADDRISVGDLVAAVGLAQFLLGPLSQLSATGAAFARARASAVRVATVLAAPRHESGDDRLPEPAPGALAVDTGLMDLRIDPGEFVGVVSDSAEAAEIVTLLATSRYSDASSVRVDGVPVGSLGPAAAASALLVADRGGHLFAESMLDNVLAGQPNAERIGVAIEAADADQVAATLPEGLDTVLAERGRSLSGGQRQRVMLARALAADPEVLVLHDPTTAVDAATEARIAAGLRALRTGRTTVIVTTSPVLLAGCDRVVLLRDGAIYAEGTHARLAETEPSYRELVLT